MNTLGNTGNQRSSNEATSLLSNLPDINFAEKDTAIIEAEIISRFEEKLGRPLYRGDPWRQPLLDPIP